MKQPLLYFCIAFISGIFISLTLPLYYILIILTIAPLSILCKLFFFPKSEKSHFTLYISIIILCLAIGIFRAEYVKQINIAKVYDYFGSNVKVNGEIIDIKKYQNSYTIVLETKSIIKDNIEKPVKTKIKVNFYNQSNIFKIRDIITISGNMQKFEQSHFYGDYSKRNSNASKGIYSYISSFNSYNIVSNNYRYFDIVRISYNIRGFISNQIDKYLNNDEGALLKGILIGDTSNFSDDLDYSLKLSGLSHIAAVSGQNISIFLAFFSLFLYKISKNRIIITLSLVTCVIFYMIIIGGDPSILRAGIMTVYTLIILSMKQRQNPLMALMFATAILSLINPYITYSVGFQLSFFSTLGIILFANKLKKNIFTITASVFLLTSPILAYYFNAIPLSAFFTNFLVAPLFIISLILGYLMCIFPPLHYIVQITVKLIILIAKGFANIPFFIINVPSPHIKSLVIYYILMYILYILLKNYKNFKSKQMYFAIVIITAIIIDISITSVLNANSSKVNFVSLGNANGIHIKTSKGYNILIDCGAPPNAQSFKSQMQSYLIKNNIKNLDAVIITNYKSEHIGGLIDLYQNVKINKIFLPKSNNDYTDIKGDLITYYEHGNITLDNARIDILNKFEDKNDACALLNLKINNNNFLLTSDVSNEVIKQNIDETKYNVMLLPNHASVDTQCDEIIDTINPKYIIASCNNTNKSIFMNLYNYPYKTSTCGTISFTIKNNGTTKIETLRPREEEY